MKLNKLFKINEPNIYILSIIVLITASYFSLGFHHPDEHFQILEFAALKLNLTTAQHLPWEYHSQMRPTAQPFIAYCLHNLLKVLGIQNPFTTAFLLRLLSAMLSFVGLWLVYNVYKNQINQLIFKKWYLLLSFLLWFVLYNSVRFSSENWSGACFIIAFGLYFYIKKLKPIWYLCIGLILGCTFIFRYQAIFLIAGFILWLIFIQKEKARNIALLIAGIAIVTGIGIIIDYWFYNKWVLTLWNYFEQNIIQNKASNYGVSPWYYYFTAFFNEAVPPFSLLFIIAIIIFTISNIKSPITWSILPFIAIHCFIGHKEMRFLFPIAAFMPIVLIKAIEIKHIANIHSNKYFLLFIKLFFIFNFLFLTIVALRPVVGRIRLYQVLYNNYKNTTTLYYLNNNPYHKASDIYFYKQQNLTIQQINSVDSIKKDINCTQLIAFTYNTLPRNFEQTNKLVYASYPYWITKFNFNNWLNRVDVYYVYEIGK